MVRIRQGKIEDFSKLNQEWAWSPHDESQQKAQKDYIAGIEAGKQEFWVVEDRGEILGELHLYWDQNDKDEANGKHRAYLSALRIHPEHRNKGLGTQLIQRVLERIKEKGFTEVTIGVYHHEPEIQALYQKWGFTKFVKGGIEEATEGKPKFLLFLKRL